MSPTPFPPPPPPPPEALGEAPLAPRLTPSGQLSLAPDPEAPTLDATLGSRLAAAFARGPGHGLVHLGAEEVATVLPPTFVYWRDLGARYLTALCAHASSGASPDDVEVPVPDAESRAAFAAAAPPMPGAEYLSGDVVRALWGQTDAAFRAEWRESRLSLQDFLKGRHEAWNLVGRVHFHLAEHRADPETPFAFLATYTTRLSSHGKAQHLPLGRALEESAGPTHRGRLLSLLVPVQRAGETCPWVKTLVETGEVFSPLRWTPAEAFQLLQDVPRLEAAGVVVRVPAGWKTGRPPRARVTATVGEEAPTALGMKALLDFRVDVTIDGERLTAKEVRDLLRATNGLAWIRGRWVEVDDARLDRTLERFREIERLAKEHGLSFAEAARLLAGADLSEEGEPAETTQDWGQVLAGSWLADTLRALRGPEGLAPVDVDTDLRGTLRPYQRVGVRWLHLLARLGLGACLADDMGLGKTVQVLALLLLRRREAGKSAGAPRREADVGTPLPSLLVAPASLLANWASEIDKFAPSLRALVLHPSTLPASEVKQLPARRLAGVDLVVTTYGTLLRAPWISARTWDLVVLDEAQAIKNPTARQTRAAKALSAQGRIALTGTPVENRLGDLWSIFDFLNPGLLGSPKEFTTFTRRLAKRDHDAYAPLRNLVRPYILRRLKTDRTVITDLPDKTEVKAWCALTPRQVALYQEAVDALAASLADAEGIRRRGVVLASLMRLKQICNHPSQWLGDGGWAEEDSGKFARLRDLAEVVASRQEKALVFTQFRETTEPVAAFLGQVFGRAGLVLHGGTPVPKRRDLVRRFQEDDRIPFFVVSLKAGGSGLNLTAASHVVHFDRWWNPAVENQATDRAFRIGQTMNVLVHKFLCRGTVEERIDELIESKRALATDVLEGGGDVLLTEMGDEELLRLVALDVRTAAKEA